MTHNPQPIFSAGQYVRFKHIDINPTPLRVAAVTIRGWLCFEGKSGTYPPNLFERVDPPQEKTA